MLITLRVKRVYKGNLQPEVELHTGMGGGDCGMSYQAGLDYLVYSSAQLGVSICGQGGWLGDIRLAAELRYLRGERPIPADLAPLDFRSPAGKARQENEREEFISRYGRATGQICGTVNPPAEGAVAFLPTVGSHAPPQVDLNRGKFCSGRLGPGRYYLFLKGAEHYGYFPGVIDRAKAAALEVRAGQTSNVVFQVPREKRVTVRGFISTDEKSGLPEDGPMVLLIGPDGFIWKQQAVDFQGSFPLPRVKYFVLENVPPGRYIACAWVSGKGWFTKVVEVNVANHAKLIVLGLKHRK